MLGMVRRHRGSSATVFGALGVIVALMAVVAGGAQAAKPGNSENAKKCQKGGYENYVTSDGVAFTSEGECTSYAAQGGTLAPMPTGDPRCAEYFDLYRQNGSAFASEADCNSYVQEGGALVGLKLTNTLSRDGGVDLSELDAFGLRPASALAFCATTSSGEDRCTRGGIVGADGTFFNDDYTSSCNQGSLGRLTGIYIVGTTAEGSSVRSRTFPSACP